MNQSRCCIVSKAVSEEDYLTVFLLPWATFLVLFLNRTDLTRPMFCYLLLVEFVFFWNLSLLYRDKREKILFFFKKSVCLVVMVQRLNIIPFFKKILPFILTADYIDTLGRDGFPIQSGSLQLHFNRWQMGRPFFYIFESLSSLSRDSCFSDSSDDHVPGCCVSIEMIWSFFLEMPSRMTIKWSHVLHTMMTFPLPDEKCLKLCTVCVCSLLYISCVSFFYFLREGEENTTHILKEDK